ncbi:MAG: hypothetical protein P4L33_01055 [Capsulimonadaceae bacterium]|nr:hypothetical protein [Capsulimonadaceae bacterium]
MLKHPSKNKDLQGAEEIIASNASQLQAGLDDPNASKEETETFEKQQHNEYIAALKHWNENYQQNIAERKNFAHRIFILLSVWLSAVMIVEIACGCGSITLSEKVQLALVTTTTVNILTIFHSVTKYLFQQVNELPKLVEVSKIQSKRV